MLKMLKKVFPMNTRIQNATLEEYKKIRNWSLSIFLIALQWLYIEQSNYSILGYLFDSEEISDFVIGLLLNATLFGVIYFCVFLIHQRLWISNNIDSCYLSGIWYHVFERKIDDDKSYIRAGYIKITQNYFDLSVDAFNYNVYLKNGSLNYDKKDCSHWSFSLSELQSNGNIIACFTKNKAYTESFSDCGIMELFVSNRDHNNRVNEISGFFSDSGASTVKGNIKMYKCIPQKRRAFNFLLSAPAEWKDYINDQLNDESNDKTFDLQQLLYDAAELLPLNFSDHNSIKEKSGKKNIVTYYDTMIQDFIVSQIKRFYPNADFLGEESLETTKQDDNPLFIIDPVDGTTNFTNNCKFSCISVAMLMYGKVIEAAIYNPYLKDMFYAKKGEGAWLNGEKININDTMLSDSIVGYPNCPYDTYLTEATFDFGKQLYRNCLDLRRMGASALEICYAACGRYQLYCEMVLYPWDYMAASLIVTEAGGVITDLEGDIIKIDQRSSIVAGCPTAHKELIELYRQFKVNATYPLDIKTDLFYEEAEDEETVCEECIQ